MTDESQPSEQNAFGRKQFLRMTLAAAPMAALLGAAGTASGSAPAGPRSLTPTPTCDDGDEPTPPQTEGPYFTPNSPERSSLLEPGMPGTVLTVSGVVYSQSCQPVPDTLLDFWQADDQGNYDNVGYRLRGHQFSDAQGGYQLTTIVPGLYPGRTRHIHLKVQAPNQPILTTQLYFPGEPRNDTDRIFDPRLLMDVRDTPESKAATFDFVLTLP